MHEKRNLLSQVLITLLTKYPLFFVSLLVFFDICSQARQAVLKRTKKDSRPRQRRGSNGFKTLSLFAKKIKDVSQINLNVNLLLRIFINRRPDYNRHFKRTYSKKMKLFIISVSLLLNTLVVFGYSDKMLEADTSKPFILGKVENLYSRILGENRVLNIYLPDGYNASDTVRYPVIYLLDGSADEDFIHIVGLVQFCSFEWVNQLPKSIVVGIANVDRRRDYTFPTSVQSDKSANPTSGHSDKFISFLETELLPNIEHNYKINGSRTIIGESLGGLLATEILLKKPALFNKYIIVSPSLWWDSGSILNLRSEIYTPAFNRPTDIYIGVGKEGLTPTDTPRVMEVDANLLADKLSTGKNRYLNIRFDYLPEENHGTIMHQAVLHAFRLLSKK